MEYHYVITLSIPRDLGVMSYATWNGTIQVQEGMTRKDAFDKVFEYASGQSGMNLPNVLFFSMEPNELPGVTNAAG